MATINIKRITANILASHLASNIAGLSGKVTAVAAGPEEDLACLAVKIIPDAMIFEASNPDEIYWDEVVDDGKVVVDVGSWTGNFTIELYTNSPAEREEYEQKIIDLFQATEWAPGTLYLTTPALTVNGYASLHTAEIKFRLQEENWIDEMSFESKRYTFLEIFVDYPALTTYNAGTIESLQLALAKMDDEVADMTDVDDSYQVEVQLDGTTLKIADPAP